MKKAISGTPRWVKVFVIAFIIVVMLVVIINIIGNPFRNDMHMSAPMHLLTRAHGGQPL